MGSRINSKVTPKSSSLLPTRHSSRHPRSGWPCPVYHSLVSLLLMCKSYSGFSVSCIGHNFAFLVSTTDLVMSPISPINLQESARNIFHHSPPPKKKYSGIKYQLYWRKMRGMRQWITKFGFNFFPQLTSWLYVALLAIISCNNCDLGGWIQN